MKDILIRVLIVIGIVFVVGGLTVTLVSVALAEDFRRVEMTCFNAYGGRDVTTHHFVLGEIDPTGFLVKELRMAGSRPYVLLVNPEDTYETRELVWSAGWRCLLERHIKQ